MSSLEQFALTAPVFLIAMPQVLDPFFHKSVVLLVHQDAEGSHGFIINRPTTIRIAEILAGMEISWEGPEVDLAFFGGPVQPQMGTVLVTPATDLPNPTEAAVPSEQAKAAEPGDGAAETSAPDKGIDAGEEVTPGIFATQHMGDLASLAANPPSDLRLFLGYAGWESDQLVEEIARNDWVLAPVNQDLVFSSKPEEVWEKALESVGIDPAFLPSWTTAGNPTDAN